MARAKGGTVAVAISKATVQPCVRNVFFDLNFVARSFEILEQD